MQQPVANLPDTLWDAVIVGAGPAGSACALELARRGHRVALVDRARFPRDKVCGGGLIADSVHALRRLGLWDDVKALGHPVGGVALFSPSQIEVRSRGEYLTVDRAAFDHLLARRAVEQGAHFAHGTIAALQTTPGSGVLARAADGTLLRARALVLATGVQLALARGVGLAASAQAAPDAVAVCRRVRSPGRVDRLVASFDRSVLPGYAWVFPLAGGEFSVGCGIFHRGARRSLPDLKHTFDRFAREFPLARELLQGATEVGPLRGAPLRCGLRGAAPVGVGPVLAVGETVGATFPFTGEGIGKALETGVLAAEALDGAFRSGRPDDVRRYAERVHRELRPKYWGYQIAEAWVRHPWLIDFMARRVLKSRHLQRAASGILTEATDPRKIFSFTGVLRSLLP